MFLPRRRKLKPVEAVTWQGQQVRKFPDRREGDAAHALDGRYSHEPAQVKLDWLRKPRQIVNAQYTVRSIVLHGAPVFARELLRGQGSCRVVLAYERQDAGVAAGELVVRAEAEDRMPLPDLDHPL